ncbi:hypothetical protein F442_02770 [Phytophthora nicotianae P10297]|uniref:RxLR effector protein n=1 Tax=Phytophthora nicotianae P10297 TaxID=1317064 RepID=W2ZZ17_PHYNI|nr:hypothetical protein F442_02770 [Phytophthora nicotianae P10297]
MRLLYPVLVVMATLVAISEGNAAEVNAVATKVNARDSIENTRKLSDPTEAALEERKGGGGGRGGGRRGGTSTRTSTGRRKFDRSGINPTNPTLGFMYPSDTPYLKDDIRKLYVKWLKKKQAKKKKQAEKKKAEEKEAETTRRLRA